MKFQVNWQEVAILLLVLVLLMYYLIKRKQIIKEEELRKKMKVYSKEQNPDSATETIDKRKATPQMLTAYERMMVFLERIETSKIATRVYPISEQKQDYAQFLIQHIEQEYDFNISQQLYISEEAWALVLTAKNSVIQYILKTALDVNITNAIDLRNQLMMHKDTVSLVELAKTRLRKEVAEFLY